MILNDNTEECKQAVSSALERALQICGSRVEGYAIDLCPVGTPESTGIKGYRGGSLRSTIRWEMPKSDEVDIIAGGMQGIYRYVDYALYVENGKRRSQPFLRPALKNHFKEITKIIESELRKG